LGQWPYLAVAFVAAFVVIDFISKQTLSSAAQLCPAFCPGLPGQDMAHSCCAAMHLHLLALVMSLNTWAATSCPTEHVNGYTAGRGVTGNNCPKVMKDGDTCQATCTVNSTSVGTVKCLAGHLQDVSLCISTPVLDILSVADVTKVMGSWKVGVSKEPTNVKLTNAVVTAMKMPKHFTECVWKDVQATDGIYTVNYWIIVKPGMNPEVIIDKAKGFLHSNSTYHQSFKHEMESDGTSLTSIAEGAPPSVVRSVVLRDPHGQNVNPFVTSPGAGQGLDSWQ